MDHRIKSFVERVQVKHVQLFTRILSMFVESNADPVPGCFARSVILKLDIVPEI